MASIRGMRDAARAANIRIKSSAKPAGKKKKGSMKSAKVGPAPDGGADGQPSLMIVVSSFVTITRLA